MHLPFPNNTGLTPRSCTQKKQREREREKKDSKELIKAPIIPEETIKMKRTKQKVLI